ncbi:unnamed protein product [Ectocarpus sp. 8 AP-2014]
MGSIVKGIGSSWLSGGGEQVEELRVVRVEERDALVEPPVVPPGLVAFLETRRTRRDRETTPITLEQARARYRAGLRLLPHTLSAAAASADADDARSKESGSDSSDGANDDDNLSGDEEESGGGGNSNDSDGGGAEKPAAAAEVVPTPTPRQPELVPASSCSRPSPPVTEASAAAAAAVAARGSTSAVTPSLPGPAVVAGDVAAEIESAGGRRKDEPASVSGCVSAGGGSTEGPSSSPLLAGAAVGAVPSPQENAAQQGVHPMGGSPDGGGAARAPADSSATTELAGALASTGEGAGSVSGSTGGGGGGGRAGDHSTAAPSVAATTTNKGGSGPAEKVSGAAEVSSAAGSLGAQAGTSTRATAAADSGPETTNRPSAMETSSPGTANNLAPAADDALPTAGAPPPAVVGGSARSTVVGVAGGADPMDVEIENRTIAAAAATVQPVAEKNRAAPGDGDVVAKAEALEERKEQATTRPPASPALPAASSAAEAGASAGGGGGGGGSAKKAPKKRAGKAGTKEARPSPPKGPDVFPPPLECVIDMGRQETRRATSEDERPLERQQRGHVPPEKPRNGGGSAIDRLYGDQCLEREAAARSFFAEHDNLRRQFLAAVDLVELDKAVESEGLELRNGCRTVQTLKMRLKSRWREGTVLGTILGDSCGSGGNGGGGGLSRCTSKEVQQATLRWQEQIRAVITDHKELLREVLGRQQLEAGALQMAQQMEVPKGKAPPLSVRFAFPNMFDEVAQRHKIKM